MNFEDLKGKTLKKIEGCDVGSYRVTLTDTDGVEYALYHSPDCCESVSLNEVIGDVNDLIGSPLLEASEESNQDNPPPNAGSFTWTFYKLGTALGFVTLRWLGESNGYYSESVDFAQVRP